MSKEKTIDDLREESDRASEEIKGLEVKMADARANLQALRDEINRRMRPAPTPRVSDHALLRLVERFCGVDVECLRKAVLTDEVVTAIKAGATSYAYQDVKLVIKGNTIVTIYRTQKEVA